MHIVKTTTAHLDKLVYCWPKIGCTCCGFPADLELTLLTAFPQSLSASLVQVSPTFLRCSQ